jgi:beta-glucosidase
MASNPLWGRNMECPGEDPFLSASFAYHYVHAFQGGEAAMQPGVPLKAVATPKHFTGQVWCQYCCEARPI